MSKFSFWNEWEISLQWVFKILSGIVLGLLIVFLAIEWGGLSPVYYWKITGYLEHISFPIFSNHTPLLESTIYTDIPVIFQKVFGGSTIPSNTYAYIYLVVLYIGLAGCFTIATFLKKFWYFFSMGLWMLLIVLSGIGRIGLFGFYEEVPIAIVCLLYLPLSYYFHAIHSHVNIGRRFLTFLGIVGITLVLVYFGSSYDAPLLFLVRFSYLPAAIISIIFIMIIGHEIVYGILTLTTPYTKSYSHNTGHFILLSLIYLLQLVALYLHKAGLLNWDLYYINEFGLFAISFLLGLWGIRSRKQRYEGILPFYPYTAFLYMGMGMITVATFAFQSWQANDPFIEAMQHLILYSHIGFGLMFLFYIIGNFINQLKQNLPVHQFAYVEDNFPYVSARLAGLIIVAALFFRAHYASFYLLAAGYYNGLADLNINLDKKAIASYYYKESTAQSRHNHHANFQLAQAEEKIEKRIEYLKKSVKKKPTPYAYASLGKSYENNHQFFDALFTYQEGLGAFPENWGLQNNLALLYNQTNVIDSAVYYLKKSTPSTAWKTSVIRSNQMAIRAVHGLNQPYERNENNLNRFDIQSNILACQLIAKDTSVLRFFSEPNSITLNLFTYSYLKNLGIYCVTNRLTQFLNLVDPYLQAPENISFRNELYQIKAFNLYRIGRVSEAFEIIHQLKNLEEGVAGKWDCLLGKWCLELDAPLQASHYFEMAREAGYPDATADLAYAYQWSDRASVAQFLVRKTIADSTAANQVDDGWEKLLQAMEQELISWTSYSFDKEKELLDRAKNSEGQQKTLYTQLGFDNPFFEKGVLTASRYFIETEKDEQMAYDILHQAITIHEYSTPLLMAYVDHCLNTGLMDYAKDAVTKLGEILSVEDHEAYKSAFEAKKAEAERELDLNW